jgi:hypothetical protein
VDSSGADGPRRIDPADDADPVDPAAGTDGFGAGDGDDDAYDPAADDASGHDPLRFNRWMRSSATGGVLTGIALGLQHALEGRREQPAFVIEATGEPEDPDAPITLHFDPDDPTKTVAIIRTPTVDGGNGPTPATDR